MEFGEKIRILRQEKGLTQAEVAQSIGITRRAYVSYEQQGARPRKRETYEKLANTLSCDINDLLMEDSPAYDRLVTASKKAGGSVVEAGLMAAGIGALAGVGALASPVGLLLSPAAVMAGLAAYSAGKRKNAAAQATPVSSAREAFQSFERSQKRFSATSLGLIYGRLAEMGIPFHPEVDVSVDELGIGPDAILNVEASGTDAWWLCFYSSARGMDDLPDFSMEMLAKALVSKFLCVPSDQKRKVSIVVDNEDLFEALHALKGKNSYRGNMSTILVDPNDIRLSREEYIATYAEDGSTDNLFFIVQ